MARDIAEQMIIAEWLFVETVDDVRRRSKDPELRTRYELLGIAPLLRKLLIDGTSLLDTVAVVRPDVQVGFHIRSWKDLDDKLASAGLERHFGIGGKDLIGGTDVRASTLDQFLKTVVGAAEGKDLTAKGVIRYYAHVEGGVHFGTPRETGESTLNSMAWMLLGHSTGQIQVLAHLGQIVAEALEPLRCSVLTNPTVHTMLHRKDERGMYIGHWRTVYDAEEH